MIKLLFLPRETRVLCIDVVRTSRCLESLACRRVLDSYSLLYRHDVDFVVETTGLA